MNRPHLKLCTFCMVVLISIALPLALLHQGRGEWRKEQESLRQQAGQIAQLSAQNERLSNEVARLESAPRLSADRLRELLRLRGEVGDLRGRTNRIRELEEENRRLQARKVAGPQPPGQMSEAELDAALALETLEAGERIGRGLPEALQQYAQAHTNAMPADFSELRRYFPTQGGRPTGLLLFEFVRDNGPEAGDTLILRENGAREGTDGKWRRVYAFGDGRVTEAVTENGVFEEWERGHGITPASPGR